MAVTPTAAPNQNRTLRKCIAILVDKENTPGATDPVGGKNLTYPNVWQSSDVPSGGTGVSDGDICLDLTNDDIYRYDENDTNWDKISQ